MGRVISFTIEGDPTKAVAALEKVIGKVDLLAAKGQSITSSYVGLASALKEMERQVQGVGTALKQVVSFSEDVRRSMSRSRDVGRQAADAIAQQRKEAQAAMTALQHQATSMQKVWTSANKTAAAQAQLNQRLTQSRAAAQGLQFSFGAMATEAGRVLERVSRTAEVMARYSRFASAGFRAGTGYAAQNLQSIGISARMSGLALGQQLSSLGTGTLLNTFQSALGGLAAATELGVRVGTGVIGGLIKVIGASSTAVVGALGSVIGGAGVLLGPVWVKLLSSAAFLGLQTLTNTLQAITTLVGEAVTQIGNVFTGIMEAARGAFQGALNIATQMMGQLYTMVEAVVGRVAGVLGTVGKAVLGIGGTLAGFGLRDAMATESARSGAEVLLTNRLTPTQRRAMENQIEEMARVYADVGRQKIGAALVSAVSTGFQEDLPGAFSVVQRALELNKALGTEDLEPTVRLFAKMFAIYRDELTEMGSGDPFAGMSKSLFDFINFADLRLPDVVERMGDVLAISKNFGLSFKEVITTLAQLSFALGKEETFTNYRRLLVDTFQMSEKGQDIFSRRKVERKDYTAEERAQLDVLRERVEQEEALITSLEAQQVRTRDARRADQERIEGIREALQLRRVDLQEQLRGEEDDDAKERIRRELSDIQRELITTDTQTTEYARTLDQTSRSLSEHKQRLKEAKVAYDELALALGRFRNPLEVMAEAREKLGQEEFLEAYSNIRAFTAAEVQTLLDPATKAAIAKGVNSTGDELAYAVDLQGQRLSLKFLQLWEAIKRPFENAIQEWKPTLVKALNTALSGLSEFGNWWDRVLVVPDSAVFFGSVRRKFTELFGGIFSGLGPIAPGDFWRGLTVGLDTVWETGRDVVNVFREIGSALATVVKESSALQSIWEGLKAAGGWLADTFKEVGRGDFSNLREVWDVVASTFDTVIDKVSSAGKRLAKEIGEEFSKALGWLQGVHADAKAAVGWVGDTAGDLAGPALALILSRIAYAGRAGAGGGGVGGGGGGRAGGVGVAPPPGPGSTRGPGGLDPLLLSAILGTRATTYPVPRRAGDLGPPLFPVRSAGGGIMLPAEMPRGFPALPRGSLPLVSPTIPAPLSPVNVIDTTATYGPTWGSRAKAAGSWVGAQGRRAAGALGKHPLVGVLGLGVADAAIQTSGAPAAVKEVAGWTATGAMLGTAVAPGVGTLIGAALGAIAGGISALADATSRAEAADVAGALHRLSGQPRPTRDHEPIPFGLDMSTGFNPLIRTPGPFVVEGTDEAMAPRWIHGQRAAEEEAYAAEREAVEAAAKVREREAQAVSERDVAHATAYADAGASLSALGEEEARVREEAAAQAKDFWDSVLAAVQATAEASSEGVLASPEVLQDLVKALGSLSETTVREVVPDMDRLQGALLDLAGESTGAAAAQILTLAQAVHALAGALDVVEPTLEARLAASQTAAYAEEIDPSLGLPSPFFPDPDAIEPLPPSKLIQPLQPVVALGGPAAAGPAAPTGPGPGWRRMGWVKQEDGGWGWGESPTGTWTGPRASRPSMMGVMGMLNGREFSMGRPLGAVAPMGFGIGTLPVPGRDSGAPGQSRLDQAAQNTEAAAGKTGQVADTAADAVEQSATALEGAATKISDSIDKFGARMTEAMETLAERMGSLEKRVNDLGDLGAVANSEGAEQ